MPRFDLQVLGSVTCAGPRGALTLDDPRLAALLGILAVAGDEGIERDDLVVLLTPGATVSQARNELDRLFALIGAECGDEHLIARRGTRWMLTPGAVSLDFETMDPDATEPEQDFLRDVRLKGAREFDAWLAAARRRVRRRTSQIEAPMAERVEPAPRPRIRGRAAVFAGLLVVAMGVATVRLVEGRGMTGFVAGDPVLLADIENLTGDTLMDRGILTAASIALQQSAHLRLYSRARLAGVYQRMQIANRDTGLTFELAREVAERDQVRFVLGLRLDRTTGGYRVTARLADVVLQQEVAVASEPAERESDVLAALDRVLLTVRAQLGERPADIRARQAPLPLVTTASLEALRSYAEGTAAWSRGRYPEAGELFLRATDLDTGFAMALGSLGNWHYFHHDRARGEQYFGEALRRSGRLTEFERLRLLENLASYRGNLDSALAISRGIAERFPNVVTWYNYGTSLMQSRQHQEALVAFAKALSFDSLHLNSHINSATSAKGLLQYDVALAHYRRADAIDSTALYRNNFNHEWGGTYVLLGRTADAESVFTGMSAVPNVGSRAMGLRSAGYLALWQGRLGKAIESFAEAANTSRQQAGRLTEGRNRLLLAAVLRRSLRMAEANVEVSRVMESMTAPEWEPPFLSVLAVACIRQNRLSDADVVLRLLRARALAGRPLDQAAEALVVGGLHQARGRPDSALTYLNRAVQLGQELFVQAMRAEAYISLGVLDSARAILEAQVDRPGFGQEGQDEWQRAPFVLGNILASQGDSAGAVAAYRRYLAQWRDAPSDLPELVSARSKLTVLGGRPPS